jgi:hypothetical protein
VYANNFTVNIDQSVTVNSLKKIAGSGIVAGGGFTLSSTVVVTITAGILDSDNVTDASALIVVSGSGSPTILANVRGGSGSISGATNGRWGVSVDAGFTGTLTITGNLSSGDVAGWQTSYALYFCAASGTVIVNGNATPGVGRYSPVIGLNGAGVVTVNGDVTGGAQNGAHAVDILGTGSLTVNGRLAGGTLAGVAGVNVAAGKTATIRGTSVTPGTLSSSGVGSPAILSRGTALRVSGDLYSGGIFASTGPNGYPPIDGAWSVIDGEETQYHVFNDDNYPSGNNGTQTILTQYGSDNPDQADVRDGVIYGPSGGLEGTLAVPPAASVASGVPTDDTVGTAALGLADVLAGTGAQIAAATSG